MPIYEYQCYSCGSEAEAMVSIAERDNPRQCASCGGEMKRGMASNLIWIIPYGNFTPGLSDFGREKSPTINRDSAKRRYVYDREAGKVVEDTACRV